MIYDAPDNGGEEAGAAEAGAEAEAAEGHEEDRHGRDAGEGVHADVAVELVGLLHLLLIVDGRAKVRLFIDTFLYRLFLFRGTF